MILKKLLSILIHIKLIHYKTNLLFKIYKIFHLIIIIRNLKKYRFINLFISLNILINIKLLN